MPAEIWSALSRLQHQTVATQRQPDALTNLLRLEREAGGIAMQIENAADPTVRAQLKNTLGVLKGEIADAIERHQDISPYTTLELTPDDDGVWR